MNAVKIISGIFVIISFAILAFALEYTRLDSERNFIIRNHCPVLDEATGTYKCANGKVYVLGVE